MYKLSLAKCVCFIFLVILASFLSCSGFRIDRVATMSDIDKRNSFTSSSLSSDDFLGRLFASSNVSSTSSSSSSPSPRLRRSAFPPYAPERYRGRFRRLPSEAQAPPAPPTGRIDTYVFPAPAPSRSQRSPEKNRPPQRARAYHCQRQDVARKAFLANTVVRAKAESMSSNRVHNYSVTFRILERYKPTHLPIDDTLRLTFSSDTKDMNCEIEGRGRPHDLVKAQIQQSKEYFLFLNSHGMHNYSVVGMPVLKKRRNNKKNRDLEDIRRVTSKNFGKSL